MFVSINQNKEFKRLYYRGRAKRSPFLVLYYMPKNFLKQQNINELGITVSKKVGNAVVRNKIRRRLKEAYRSYDEKLKRGMSICLLARPEIVNFTYKDITRVLGGMFKSADLFLK
jgi:ribonuclease P protein component